uniref:Multidrug resistance-associated protein 7-like n=1 Tax=Phallusia mammillata TaxID=59560 RepID=A0A6F9D618_9ASCI|nr:multidrug resistance-associated protein 7-like [Phallusia mammillata]
MDQRLTEFCGKKFSIWNNDGPTFSLCFETFTFVLAPFTLLALTSAFYIGRLRPPDVNLRVPSPFNIRRICTAITLVITLGVFIKDAVLIKSNIPAVLFVSYGTRLVSLLVHLIFLWRIGLIHFDYKRSPATVVLSWALTLGYYGVQIERMIVELMDNVSDKSTLDSINMIVDLFCVAAMAACQITYLVTLLHINPKYRTVSILSPTEDLDNLLSQSHLLDSDRYSDLASDVPSVPETCPSDSASCLSSLFFYWVQPLMKKGSKRQLNREDAVYSLPADLNTQQICHSFTQTVDELSTKQLIENQNTSTPPRILLKSLHSKFGRWYYTLGLLKFLSDSLGFAGPLLLNRLVNFVDSNEPLANGCYYAAGLFLSTLIGSMLATHFDFQVNKVATAFKSCLIASVYNKTLQAKPVAMAKYTTGEITNFMSTDVNRIVNFCASFHQFWSLPFQVVVTLILLYFQVGVVFLAGLGFALIMILFNRYLAKKIGEYNRSMMKNKDSRVKLITEILLGIRVIKFNVWEGFLIEKVNSIRSDELKSLKGIKYFDAGCVYLWATTPVIISLLIFSIYSVTGHDLTAAKVFTVVALINMLISPLNAFPWVINGLMEAWISINRLEKFVMTPNFNADEYYNDNMPHEKVVSLHNASFSWNVSKPLDVNDQDSNQQDQLLCDISFSIEKGQFIGIMGQVGAGKTSLLSALCGELDKLCGNISVEGHKDGLAYVTQEPWIQHATIKENIIWGEVFNKEMYEAVVECCALKEDFQSLPNGDHTEVGENGVTLSGGQKARVSLARAVYQNKSLYLLDDPLSAVDQHVASHLYHQCVAGILRDRTRILCTHHTRYLRNADWIIVLEEGQIKKIGTPAEVLEIESDHTEQVEGAPASANNSDPSNSHEPNLLTSLVQAEEKAVGSVALSVYKSYWIAVGSCLAITILLFVLLMQASKVVSDWWLSQWVNANNQSQVPKSLSTIQFNISEGCYVFDQPLNLAQTSYTVLLKGTGTVSTPTKDSAMWYLMIYGIIAAANSIFTLVRSFSFAYGGICATQTLHNKLLKSILQAPVSFFDVTPIGRIVNRFSSDVYTVDDTLPFMLNIFLAQFAGLLATIVITCYGLPWFTVVLIPLSGFYYYTQHYYRLTSRELKRLSSISLSPIYAHFNESLMGLTTIRAFRKEQMFREQNLSLVDANQRCNFSTLAAQEWLAIRLQMMGVVMVTGVAFTAVIEHQHHMTSAGLVGLALSYALSVTSRLSGVITSFTETEKQMVAVERQSFYIHNVPHERAPSGDGVIHRDWSTKGAIEFRHVSLQYRPHLPSALDDVSFRIRPGEKVGVVGRTGSGKSSLVTCLFGIVPLTRGAIYIDEVSTNRVPLHLLRSKMAVIPQDPFLFSGPLRHNLDPTGQHAAGALSDSKLWIALESCGLRRAVESMGGLDCDVGERGKRFSTGQRQLVCLARALLKDVQIVCLDEATANIDLQSDALIQETVRKCFQNRTVITIAHRVETILDCDRVIVMENGKLVEFEEPGKLLRDPSSLFAQLVAKSGLVVN